MSNNKYRRKPVTHVLGMFLNRLIITLLKHDCRGISVYSSEPPANPHEMDIFTCTAALVRVQIDWTRRNHGLLQDRERRSHSYARLITSTDTKINIGRTLISIFIAFSHVTGSKHPKSWSTDVSNIQITSQKNKTKDKMAVSIHNKHPRWYLIIYVCLNENANSFVATTCHFGAVSTVTLHTK